MKVVINVCFGGFSLSARGVKRYAELKGRECYFFRKDIAKGGLHAPYEPITMEEADRRETFMFFAFDIPNPNEVLVERDNWHELSLDEKHAQNALHEQHSLGQGREIDRSDPDVIRVVEELGGAHRTGASGRCAELKIVEIPDGTNYVVEEYDGNEHIAEAHQTWS